MNIRKLKVDADLDGIAAAVIWCKHHNCHEVEISSEKPVDSDEYTLVLDKQTFGKGFVIDHHEKIRSNAKYLAYSKELPTATLVYIYVNGDDDDLFLASLAEIADGLDKIGLEKGALAELKKKYPQYFEPSAYLNHFLRSERIYSIAGVLAHIARKYPYETFELLKKLKAGDEIQEILEKSCSLREYMLEYLDFWNSWKPREEVWKETMLDGVYVKMSCSRYFKFPQEELHATLILAPGNYLLYDEEREIISIRGVSTRSAKRLVSAVVNKLGNYVKSYGGRGTWWGISLGKKISCSSLLKLLNP